MNKIYLLISFITCMASFTSEIDIDISGETRIRTEYYLETDDINTDIRSQISLKITVGNGFYQKTKLELGNIDLNPSLTINDFYEIETKKFYLGYKSDLFKGKIGIIDVETSGFIYSGEDLGIQLKVKLEDIDFKGFYTLQNIVDDTWDVLEDFSNLNHLIYLSTEFEGYSDSDISFWMSYFKDNDEADYSYNLLWLGAELEKKYNLLVGRAGIIYNIGEVITNNIIPINSWMLYADVKMSIDKRSELVTRFNFFVNSESTGTINQFQTVDGDGEINSELSLLTEQVLDMDNLSTNDLVYNNSSLFFYEIGMKKQLKNIPLEYVIAIGGVSEGNSVIGFEMDFNNKIELLKNLDLNINTAYLLKSGTDNYKVDCNLEYHF